jgi:hypothetical protein
MATINIGNLTFTHKGDYASGTAYVKNDVVYYSTNGNAYIAKQATTGNAPTNATYWNQFAAGSGGIWNAGLSLGSAGQAVKVNAAGNALEFGAVAGGKVLQVVAASTETNVNSSSTSFVNTGGIPSFSFTPSATSSKVLLIANFGGGEGTGSNAYWTIYRDSSNLGNSSVGFTNMQYSSAHRVAMGGAVYLDSPNTTSAVTYQLRIRVSGDSWNFGEGSSVNLAAMEIGA